MAFFTRKPDLRKDAESKSLFLFGPRQTGKTSLLKQAFPQAPFYNLLLSDVFLRLSQRPQTLREEVLSQPPEQFNGPVIIDEIQKLPVLLDEVQALIDQGYKFILTGSSARKLRHGGVNLLGGRAWTRHLFPLVTAEIGDYDLIRILNHGSLPFVYTSDRPEEEMKAYVGNYLQEEIQAEGLVRKIENFSRFLQTASLYNGELLNFANVGSDAAVPARTVAEYFKILEDTLIGTLLEPLSGTVRRKAIATAKFYFFDVGVCNALAGRMNIRPKTELFGKVFEHFIFTEICAFLSYTADRRPLNYWRSKSGLEVDFVIGAETAVEVKASDLVTERHISGIRALSEDLPLKRKIVVSMDPSIRRLGDVEIMPVRVFLEKLWQNDI